jgi:CheY-like chemotaxis protein
VTRILYVEDNDDNVYMLKTRLELLDDFEVLVAENGEIGCARAAADRPDLIMMDLELPVVDGWEAMRRLRHDPATRDIPIIALSAHALTGSREKAVAAGCDEFDTKPVNFDRLVATIRRVLSRAAASRPLRPPIACTAPPPPPPARAEEIGMRVAEACP